MKPEYPMRRKNREVTDRARMDEVIRDADCCRVAWNEPGGPYIVPKNFGYSVEGETRIFYFHGAFEGKKIDFVREQPEVGFQLDTGHRLVSGGAVASAWSFDYASVIGKGIISFVTEPEEKRKALLLLMEHYTGRTDWALPPAMLERVNCLKLTVRSMTCKISVHPASAPS